MALSDSYQFRTPAVAEVSITSEAELVARAKHDRQAFAPLYRTYVGPVYRYCYHRLGTREAAEDATSEVFIKALANLPLHRADRSFRSWLFAIAHNVVVDTYRTNRTARPLGVIPEIVDLAPTPEERALIATAVQEVRGVLAELPAGQREIIELRLVGLTGTEIAEILGRSPGAIKISQLRAYASLRLLLDIPTTQISEK